MPGMSGVGIGFSVNVPESGAKAAALCDDLIE